MLRFKKEQPQGETRFALWMTNSSEGVQKQTPTGRLGIEAKALIDQVR